MAALSLTLLFAVTAPAAARELRVCADPNNLPFSNERREGFENRIAEAVAAELGRPVAYVWWAQRRGSLRALRDGICDLIPGLASGVTAVRTTSPYYRSTYVFVSRLGGPEAGSFDDPALARATIGVQMIGDDGFNTPPAHALSRRGLVGNVRGYLVYGDYGEPNPPSRIVRAVADGEVDLAVVWGPLAGYFGPRAATPLKLAPVRPAFDGPTLPMVFDVSMAVRKQDEALGEEVEGALARLKPRIDAILAEYGVPRADLDAPFAGAQR